jgi:GDP-D-mannose dehydratase
MWMMLQTTKPDDFCIATGTQITVREFVTRCFRLAGWLYHVTYFHLSPQVLTYLGGARALQRRA